MVLGLKGLRPGLDNESLKVAIFCILKLAYQLQAQAYHHQSGA